MKALQEQIDRKEKEIETKNKDLQEVTLILSKRDKEIQQLKKDIEQAQAKQASSGAAMEEMLKMRDYIRTLESE